MNGRPYAIPVQYPLRITERDGVRVHLIGHLHGITGDPATTISTLTTEDGRLRDAESLCGALRALHGNFAVIVEDRCGQVLASVDKVKSYPLCYAEGADGRLRIAGDAQALPVDVGHRRNADALLEFAMAGYVTNGETLIQGIRQLRGGELLIADRDGAAHIHDYYQFHDAGTPSGSPRALMEELHAVTTDVFRRLIVRLNGRTALIPLSGGYDSRLVISMLKHLGYDAIRAFSYGIPKNCEARAAQAIADRLGVPWTFIPYTRAFGRAMYRTDERVRYFTFAHQRWATPMMMDFYAFCDLARRGALPRDVVVINGQTGDFVSGGHIPATCTALVVTRQAWIAAILSKHYSLWTHLRTPAHDERMAERILRSMPFLVSERMTSEEAAKAFELWEWRARQCEHVVAGQRTYDFFGLPWELPLWDDAYLDFWSRVPFPEKFRQSLYLEYLRMHDPFGVFQTPFRRYTPPWTIHLVSEALRPLGRTGDALRRQYLRYWQKYAYFYAIYPYREYIRFGRYHRNPVSCLAKDILAEEYGERISP